MRHKRWIQASGIDEHRGALHRELGIPRNRKIPPLVLKIAARAPGKLGRRAREAMTMRRISARRRRRRRG